MDRYSRGYDERYRGYYDRPRSDTYRPGESYRSEREYREVGGRGRNYSPNPHYSSSRSPGGRGGGSGGMIDSRGGVDDNYPKDHRYGYNDSRPYYSSSRGPSPSRSDSRSPRRPSYGYYRSGPSSSYPYSSRRSPSPPNGGRSGSSSRRDSYDHRPYHGSPSYPSYPPYHRNGGGGGGPSGSPYPPYSSRRHYGGPSSFPPSNGGSGYGTPSGYRSREPSTGPPLQQQQQQQQQQHHQQQMQQPQGTLPQRSLHSTPSSTAPNSPKQPNYNITQQGSSSVPINPQPHQSISTPSSISISQQKSLDNSTNINSNSNPNNFNNITSSATTTTTTPNAISLNNSSQPAPSSISVNTNYTSSSYPYSSPTTSSPYAGGGPPRPHHHNYHHNSHYNNNYQPHHSSPATIMPPIRQRLSWAPDQEKEAERYHNEQRKLCEEENKILANVRKSRFELELGNWDTRKLERQLDLVQKQWEDNGMEQLVRDEINSRLPGRSNVPIRSTPTASTSLSIL